MPQERSYTEVERKFLIGADFDDLFLDAGAQCLDYRHLLQGYLVLPREAGGREVRVRRERKLARFTLAPGGEDGWQDEETGEPEIRVSVTAKAPAEGTASPLVRLEAEAQIHDHDFRDLWRLTTGRRIFKTRVSYMADAGSQGPRVVTVDAFARKLSGLFLVEVEFEDADEAARYMPPSFFGPEVTSDARFRNASLAEASAPPG